MARVRSPNYPALGLPAALDRARAIHKAEGRNAIAREAMVKHCGFGTLNGASATVLSALAKFGLIEPAGEGEARVSDLAMRILFPHAPDERQAALEEAAFRPALFAEIREKWPERPPGDESLRSFLVRKGFSAGALDQVIQFYRETLDIAVPKGEAHDPRPVLMTEGVQMTSVPTSTAASTQVHSPALAAGKPFSVAFDGTVLTGTIALRSVRDIDRLVKVLNAQKAALEAMQDDEGEQGGPGADPAYDTWVDAKVEES